MSQCSFCPPLTDRSGKRTLRSHPLTCAARKLDHIPGIVIKPLPVTHKALATRYKNGHNKDIAAHCTRYRGGMCERFVRKNVLSCGEYSTDLDDLCASFYFVTDALNFFEPDGY